MNLHKILLPLLLILALGSAIRAQAPARIHYQAVARNVAGEVIGNQAVSLRLSILDGSVNGPVIYQETHSTQTSGLGLFNLEIGGGSVQSGSFPSINWAQGPKFIRVEMDPSGGGNYLNMGTSPLLSVPYALYAASGGTPYAAGAGIQLNGQTIVNTGDLNPNDDLLVTSNFSGDVGGTYNNLQIQPNTVGSAEISDQSISGADISPMGAAPGEVLKWNGASWQPATDLTGGGGAYTAGTGIQINGTTISALNDNVLWNALKLYGRNISSMAPASGQVLKWDGSLWAPANDETGGGGGSYQAGVGISIAGNTISAQANDPLWNATRLQGRFVAETLPSNGQALVWNNVSARWEPQTLSGSGLGGSGNGNYIAKFTGTNSLGNSILFESPGGIGLSTTGAQGKLHIKGTADQPQLLVQAHSFQSNGNPLILARDGSDEELFRLHADHNPNLFIGRRAGMNNQVMPTISGEFNTFIGSLSGEDNVVGNNNSAVGYETLGDNTSGSNNSALGAWSLRRNGNGSFNAALGAFALEFNTSGQFNTSVGASSMNSNISGSFNTALGGSALNGNNSGEGNVAVGHRSLFSSSIGSRNVAIGQDAMFLSSFSNYNVAIGTHAMYRGTGRNYLVAVGDSALYNNGVGAVDPSQSRANTAIGSKAMMENSLGAENTAVGYQAMMNSLVGSRNTGVGYQVLQSNQLGEENTAIGWRAMFQSFTGLGNTAVGMEALFANAEGDRNTAIGQLAIYNNSSGDENTGVGYKALEANQTGNYNVAVGASALNSNNAADFNTAVGAFALDFTNTTGNTALGYKAGGDFVQGENNTYIGANAKSNLSNYTNSTALGANVTITGSNMVRIGSSTVTSIGGFANWSNVSDGRIKRDVREDVRGLDFIRRLRPVTYSLDRNAANALVGAELPAAASSGESQRLTGFIAQEVETAARASGYEFSGVDQPRGERDIYGLRYAEFVVPLVKAMQEQQQILDAQAEMIRQLREELDALKKEMKKD